MPTSKPPTVNTPHDKLFKATFVEPRHAASLVQSVVPAGLLEGTAWDTLRPEDKSFVDEALASRHTDILFTVERQGQQLLLYFLIEHQSQNDPLMAYRVSRYVHRVLERYANANPSARTLPMVLPLVVSHVPKAWSAPLELLDLFEVPEDARSTAAPYLPRLRYFLEDLSAQTEEAIILRKLSDEATLTFLALREATTKSFVAALKRWAGILRRLQATPDGLSKTARFLHYMLDVGEDPPETLRDVLQENLGPEASDLVMSTAERLREEGRLEGQAKLLLRLLELKFGALPEGTSDRLLGASSEQIERWGDRVLTATSLDDALS